MTISKIREALEYYANEEFQSDVIDVGSCGVASTYDSETACIKAKEALTLIDQMQGDMVERVAIAMYNAAIDAAGIGDVIYKAQAKAAIDTIMGDVRKDADAHSTPAPLVVLETPSPATTKPVSLEKMSIKDCRHVDTKAHLAVCNEYGTNGYHDGQQVIFFADIIEAYETAKQQAHEGVGAPFLGNYADGVDGHYCIARKSSRGDFYEFYEAGKWVSATRLIFHLGKTTKQDREER